MAAVLPLLLAFAPAWLPVELSQESRIRFQDLTVCREPPQLHAESSSDAGVGSEIESLSRPVESREMLLYLDRTRSWNLSSEGDGCWAEPVDLHPADTAEAAVLSFWRTGKVILTTVADPDGESAPSSLTSRFASVPTVHGGASISTNTTTCLRDGDRWECTLPATKLDLKFGVPGFAPHYFWEVEIKAGEAVDLGKISLTRGASVAGWVAGAPAEIGREEDGAGITVSIAPASYGDHPQDARSRSRRLETQASERGFFQFTNLPLGTYVTEAAASGTSPAKSDPIEVHEEIEYLLDAPLELEPLAWLEVFVDPPADVYSRPWNISIGRQTGRLPAYPTVARGEVAEDGYWLHSELENGRYRLRVYDSRGNQVHYQTVVVRPGQPPLTLRLPESVAVEGTFAIGEDPWPAKLQFSRSSGQQVRFEADEDGEFEGYLPEEGEWNVTARLAGGHESRDEKRWVGPIEVARAPGRPAARVDIELPDAVIHGRVVDSSGKPAVPALVNVMRDARPATQYFTDKEGAFEIRGLEPGELTLHAEGTGQRRSRDVPYKLLEDREGPEVELVVEDMLRFRGIVMAPHGPVPGTLIRYYGPQTLLRSSEAIAGPGGRFEMTLPAGTSDLAMTVIAPGYPRRILRVPVAPGVEGQEIVIPVTPIGGLLSVQPGTSLSKDGVTVPFGGIMDPLGLGSIPGLDELTGRLQLLMEPGIYRLCVQEAGLGCSEGELLPNGTLVLDHPPPPDGVERPNVFIIGGVK